MWTALAIWRMGGDGLLKVFKRLAPSPFYVACHAELRVPYAPQSRDRQVAAVGQAFCRRRCSEHVVVCGSKFFSYVVAIVLCALSIAAFPSRAPEMCLVLGRAAVCRVREFWFSSIPFPFCEAYVCMFDV